MSEYKRQKLAAPTEQYYGQDPSAQGYEQQQQYDPMAMGAGMGGQLGMGMERMFPCLRLRGLPFDVSEDEIRLFLGCDPVDILLIKRDGRFSGEAFVLLGSPMHVEMAMAKNKTYMGRRYIEVFRAKKLDYYKGVVSEMLDGAPHGGRVHSARGGGMDYRAVSAYGDPSMYQDPAMTGLDPSMTAGYAAASMSTVVRLRGLPFSTRKEDIIRWFSEDSKITITPLTADDVHLISEYGRPAGTAFVDFQTPQDAQLAMSKDKQMMGTRYVELFPSSRQELERLVMRGAQTY